VWVREKTGCRRRNVINQDLGAEEQKASGVVVIIIDGVNTNQQSTTFQSFFGVSTHYSYGSVSSCSGPDPSSPNSSPSFSPIVESINHLIAFLDDLMRNFLASNLIWGLNEAATERMRGVSTINKLLRLSMMDGPTPWPTVHWSDQPVDRAGITPLWSSQCHSPTVDSSQPGYRHQQQVVENQVSNWPTRYMVLGGFTPGTPVSTPLFFKNREKGLKKRKELKRLKREF